MNDEDFEKIGLFPVMNFIGFYNDTIVGETAFVQFVGMCMISFLILLDSLLQYQRRKGELF